MTTKKLTNSEITDDVIAKWKTENSKVFKWTTTDKKYKGYFKSPDISAMEASSVMASTKPITSNKLLAKACFLGGDEEIFEDARCLLGLGKKLQELMDIVEGEFEEL